MRRGDLPQCDRQRSILLAPQPSVTRRQQSRCCIRLGQGRVVAAAVRLGKRRRPGRAISRACGHHRIEAQRAPSPGDEPAGGYLPGVVVVV